MKKTIITSSGGQNAKVADLLVNRLLPDKQLSKVGPFVFLDHLYPAIQQKQEPKPFTGKNAHPHRGIATFSYLLSGSLEHFDSRQHHGIVEAGGAQWMNAGNGIIHDERTSPDFQRQGGLFHALQFWINLPSNIKEQAPDYLAVNASDIPETELPDCAGIIRVLIGVCGSMASPVKTYKEQFIYHFKLNPKSAFTYKTKADLEYAVFVPADKVIVNDIVTEKSHLLSFSNDDDDIEMYNPGITTADLFIFGGEEYTEPIVSEGPFVMNTRQQISQAYDDFFEGKYGVIDIMKK